MGNLTPTTQINCKQRCSDIINETKSQIQRFNPFSKIQQQIPYAQPLETNIYGPNLITQQLFDKIIHAEPLKVPQHFEKDQSYEYDQKYWKKQQPNIVIQGNWFKRKPHGLCKIFFPTAQNLFISYFNHGQPLFQDCLIIFENGSYYHGSLKNLKFDGQEGKYVHFDKSVIIEGEWRNGQPSGEVKQKILFDQQQIYFQGQFNHQSQKQGEKCSYIIKNTESHDQKLFEYYGGFKNDQFFGKGSIKTNEGQYQLDGMFRKDNVEIEKLETQQFYFTGQMDKLLNEGTGKVKTKEFHRNIVCQGTMKNGMLNGPGTVIHQQGEMQKVYWFNGIRLKHVRNYDNPIQLSELLQRIEIYYSTSKTYNELTKQLQDYFKGHHLMEVASPRRLQFSYIFEMITKQKTNVITSSTRLQLNETQIQGGSNLKTSTKKQLIIQLQKGRFLYVSCFTRDRQ